MDVSQTLYDHNKEPLEGSYEFLQKYKEKIIVVSNIGSITGDDLRIKLNDIFSVELKKVITSLDLVIEYLNKSQLNNIFHYGSDEILKKLRMETNLDFIDDHLNSGIECVLFTSLCSDSSWIKRTQNALNIMTRDNVNIILGNPDRSCPTKPHNFTVSLIHDALLYSCAQLGYDVHSKEIGKPNIKFEEIGVALLGKTIVVGDNPRTDGLLAANNRFDYAQVGIGEIKAELRENIAVLNVKNLKEMI